MNSFPLKIVTPDGVQFDGEAQQLLVRTIDGDMAVMAGHVNCVAPLGMGQAVIVSGEECRTAACIGGILTVLDGQVRLVPTTFEWSDAIDYERAKDAEQRARQALEKARNQSEIKLASARLSRALVRQSVAHGSRK